MGMAIGPIYFTPSAAKWRRNDAKSYLKSEVSQYAFANKSQRTKRKKRLYYSNNSPHCTN